MKIKVASAQVKSAMLLAALNAPGRSRIVQRALTRDHTEKMLKAFGADIEVEPLADGGEAITVMGEAELQTRSDRGAARSVVGGLSAGRGTDRAGFGRCPFPPYCSIRAASG